MVPRFSGRLDTIRTEDQRDAYENRFPPAGAVIADTIADLRNLGLSEADEAAVLSGDAERLLGVSGAAPSSRG